MPQRRGQQELEIMIRFRDTRGEYSFDKDTEARHIDECARVIAEHLKKFGYVFKDVERIDHNYDNRMRRHFVVMLQDGQTAAELKRRLDNAEINRSWTYCEVF